MWYNLVRKNGGFMKTKILIIIAVLSAIIFYAIYSIKKEDSFLGLKPLYEYNGYKIYDLVKQKNLACAEAIEYFPNQVINGYQYYFECLKSDQIYMVKDGVSIKIKDAYNQGLIPIEKMYEFKLVGRMITND